MKELIQHLEAAGLHPVVIDENTKFPTKDPSPFLEGTNIQFAWDSTSIGYLKTCPRLYQYVMIEGWTGRHESIHLRFGTEYHKALEDYDRLRAEGASHDDGVHNTVRELLIRTADYKAPDDDGTRGEKIKTRAALVRTVIWYLDQFEDDPAKTVILNDGRPAVELSFQFDLDWGPLTKVLKEESSQSYVLCGHLDRVVEYMDSLFVMDRKTTTTTPSAYYFNSFEPNNQMSLYTLASKVILGSPIKGVIIDAAQVLSDSSRFVRGFTYRTSDQLDEYIKDLEYWFNLAESYAEANYWPMNETSCDKYGGCRFRDICSKSPSVREQFLKSAFVKGEPWNPLKIR
jgi:hypothetical protein